MSGPAPEDRAVVRAFAPPWVWVVAAVAAVLALIATRHGPGVSNDSVDYLSAGINLAHGHGLRNFSGGVVTTFPPGLPLVVAAGVRVGIGATTTLRLLDAAAFAATVLLAFVLLREHVRSAALVAVGTVFVAVAYHLFSVEYMAWSEPAFVVACLAFVLILERAVRTPRATLVVATAAVASVAFLFRYAGLALLPAGAVAFLLGPSRDAVSRRLRDAIAFAAFGAVVPIAVMAGNHALDGSLMGRRIPSETGLRTTVETFVSVLGSWVLPVRALRHLDKPVGALVVAAAIVAGCVALLLRWRSGRRDDTPTLVPLVAFSGLYAVFVVASSRETLLDVPSDRFLCPLLVPLLVLGVVALERTVGRLPVTARRAGLVTLVVALAAFTVDQAWYTTRRAQALARDGVQYTSTAWRSSPLTAAAARVREDAVLYSDAPQGLWSRTGDQPIRFPPSTRDIRVHRVVVDDVAALTRTVACRPAYLAWFSHGETALRTPAELAADVRVATVGSYRDGTLYRLLPRPGREARRC